MKQIPSKSFYDLIVTGPESNYDAGIQEAEIISDRSTLLRDLADIPLRAKTYAFLELISSDLPDCKRCKNVFSATRQTLRNTLKKVGSKQSRGPNFGVDCINDNLGDGTRRMLGQLLRGKIDSIDNPSLTIGVDCRTDNLGDDDLDDGDGRMPERPSQGKVDFIDCPSPNIGVDCRINNLGNGDGRMDGRPLRGEIDFSNYPWPNKEGCMDGSRQRGGQGELTQRCLWQRQPRSLLIQVSTNIVSNGLDFLKSVSIPAVCMTLLGNIPTAEARSLQANEDIEKSPDFWFGLIQTVAALFTVIGGLIQVNKWRRRHSSAGTSAASAPAGPISSHPESRTQKLTVLRLLRETEYCEVLVARRD